MSKRAMAVVGGGTMGTGIAYVFALAGWKVTVVEPNESRVDAMFGEIANAVQGAIDRGSSENRTRPRCRARSAGFPRSEHWTKSSI